MTESAAAPQRRGGPLRLSPQGPLRGAITLPGDKSISHRALLFNAIAEGEAVITGALDAGDTRSTQSVLGQLGVPIHRRADGALVVQGQAGRLKEPQDVLDCGNSGTTLRTLLGLLAGQPFFATLTGDASLRRRPMGRLVQPLRALGAQIDGVEGGRRAPLSLRGGTIRGGELQSDVASAQVKTALLLAALQGEGALHLQIPDSRDHSERMLLAMGVHLEQGPGWIRMESGQRLRAADVAVPGDISSAAFWLVAASIVPGSDLRLLGCGLNPTRDGVLRVLRRMGAQIDVLDARDVNGEPVADLRVRSAALRGVEIGGDEVPTLIDELPVLAVAAAVAEGPTEIRDAAELRVKESDRIRSTLDLLRALGASAEERPDGLRVQGGARLQGGWISAAGDHRIAMAGCVAACLAEGETQIDGAEAISVSYPTFLTDLSGLRDPRD